MLENNFKLDYFLKQQIPQEYLSHEVLKSIKHLVNTLFLYRSNMKTLNVKNELMMKMK